METGLVFDKQGFPLHWHLPPGRNEIYIPDSSILWNFIWDYRDTVGGIAHTHPGGGPAIPSTTDLTTFYAIELGLGKRLDWVIATMTDVETFRWRGPGKLDYKKMGETIIHPTIIEELRILSRNPHFVTSFIGENHAGSSSN